MAELQLRLFPHGRPLVERLGRDFFRAVPKSPGVYLMHGAGRLLYVGKARNLRQRLGSYRYVTERTPRRTLRLVHAVDAISWEILASETDALLRENELLRTCRPRFNRLNTYPRRHPFIEVRECGGSLTLRLVQERSGACYGAYKANVHAAFGAMLRLMWAGDHGASYASLPRPLLLGRAPREWSFDRSADPGLLHAFLAGASDAMLRRFEPADVEPLLFHRQFRAGDIGLLEDFFTRGPLRNREWMQKRGLTGSCVESEQLDDWAVMEQLRVQPAGES